MTGDFEKQVRSRNGPLMFLASGCVMPCCELRYNKELRHRMRHLHNVDKYFDKYGYVRFDLPERIYSKNQAKKSSKDRMDRISYNKEVKKRLMDGVRWVEAKHGVKGMGIDVVAAGYSSSGMLTVLHKNTIHSCPVDLSVNLKVDGFTDIEGRKKQQRMMKSMKRLQKRHARRIGLMEFYTTKLERCGIVTAVARETGHGTQAADEFELGYVPSEKEYSAVDDDAAVTSFCNDVDDRFDLSTNVSEADEILWSDDEGSSADECETFVEDEIDGWGDMAADIKGHERDIDLASISGNSIMNCVIQSVRECPAGCNCYEFSKACYQMGVYRMFKSGTRLFPKAGDLMVDQHIGFGSMFGCFVVHVFGPQGHSGSKMNTRGRGHLVVTLELEKMCVQHGWKMYSGRDSPGGFELGRRIVHYQEYCPVEQKWVCCRVLLIVINGNYLGGPYTLPIGSRFLAAGQIMNTVYYDADFFEECAEKGFDKVSIISSPVRNDVNEDGILPDGDLLLEAYVGKRFRWFSQKADNDIFLEVYKQLPPCKRLEKRRSGGSNGLVKLDENLLRTMRDEGSSPRLMIGHVLTIAGTVLGRSYCRVSVKKPLFAKPINATSARAGGAVAFTKNKYSRCSFETRTYLQNCAYIKVMSINTLGYLNGKHKADSKGFYVSRHACVAQKMVNYFTWHSATIGGRQDFDCDRWFESLVVACNYTALAYACDNHYDRAKRSPVGLKKARSKQLQWKNLSDQQRMQCKILGSIKSFIETKKAHRLEKSDQLPPSFGKIGRGGDGPDVCVGAILDHSLVLEEINWNGHPPHCGAFIRVLQQVAVREGLGAIVVPQDLI